MPDGSIRRVNTKFSNTLDDVLKNIESNDVDGFSKSANGPLVQQKLQLNSLCLKNGDFLYAVRSTAGEDSAIRKRSDLVAKLKRKERVTRSDAWHPFPELARPSPPTGPSKTMADLEAKAAQTFKLIPQKKSRIIKLSIDPSSFDEYIDSLKASKYTPHRCAVMYGKISTHEGLVAVDAIYPFYHSTNEGFSYDPTPLLDNNSDSTINHASKVAKLLDMQPIGWCLSHDKRTHLLSGRDVSTAAYFQLKNMHDSQQGMYCATVTVGIEQDTGEATSMAYALSDLAVQMASEGIFKAPLNQADDAGPIIETTELVVDGNIKTLKPDTLSFVVNVPIVSHKSSFRSKFSTRSNDGLEELKKCLFTGNKNPKLPSFLRRISDFGLLVFIFEKFGDDEEFSLLCQCVREKNCNSPVLERYRSKLYAICN